MKRLAIFVLLITVTFTLIGCSAQKSNAGTESSNEEVASGKAVQNISAQDIDSELNEPKIISNENSIEYDFSTDINNNDISTKYTVDEVSIIKITDGNSGQELEVTDSTIINDIIRILSDITYINESNELRSGYQYRIRFLSEDESQTANYIIAGNYITQDGDCWNVESTESLVSYIAKLYE